MLRRATLIFAVCLIVLVAGGMHTSAPDDVSAQEPERVRVAIPGFENNMTPFTLTFAALPNTHDLIMLVYDSLFWSQVKENPEPWLAEEATPSEDRRVWTVTLREGLTWHDGEPLTAEDVKFSFEYYERFAGASGRYAHHVFDVPPFERAEVVDERTVRLYYDQPAPTFEILPGADLPIIPKHVWENVEEPSMATEDLPVGSGPYEVVEIVSDQSYRLQANEAYFKGRPTVDELELRVVSDPSAAFSALRTGEVDMVGRNVPPDLVDQLPGDVEVAEETKFESTQMLFNARKPPFDDPRLRKAISLAIDSQALVDTVLLGRGRPGLDSFIHPDSPWTLPEAGHEYDPERARELLDEAGYSMGPDGVRQTPEGDNLEFSVLVSSFEPQTIRAVQLVARQVDEIGVSLTPETLDPATLRQRRPTDPDQVPEYDAYMSGLEAHAHVDPDGLYYFFHSPGGGKGFGHTMTGYGNQEFDALAEEAAVSDIPERKPLLHEMQRIFAEEAPAIVFYYPDGQFAYRPEAYDGWVTDFGHGIFTKRSFLPEYVQTGGASTVEESSANRGLLVTGIVGAVALLVIVAVVVRRRKTSEDTEE